MHGLLKAAREGGLPLRLLQDARLQHVARPALLDDETQFQQSPELAPDRLARNARRAGNRRRVHGALAFDTDDAVERTVLRAESRVAHARLDAGRADDLSDARQVEIAEIKIAALALEPVHIVADHVDEEPRVGLAAGENQPSFRDDRCGAFPGHRRSMAGALRP